MIKCKHCDAENIDEARYCRKCGRIIEKEALKGGNVGGGASSAPKTPPQVENIVNLYPDYQFKPVSLAKIPAKTSLIKWCVFSLVGAIIFFALGVGVNNNLFVVAAVFVVLLIILSLSCKSRPLKKDVADYIQKKGSPVRFIVKDGKFGIYNIRRHRVTVTPEYDCLRVKEGQKFIYIAFKGHKRFEIDVNGNVLN